MAIFAMDGHRLGAKRLLCKLANSARTKDGVPVLSEGKAPSDETPSVPEELSLSASMASPARSSASSSESIPRTDSSSASLSPRFSATSHGKTPSTNLYIKNLVTTDSEGTLNCPVCIALVAAAPARSVPHPVNPVLDVPSAVPSPLVFVSQSNFDPSLFLAI